MRAVAVTLHGPSTLARLNLANRATLRAFEQAHSTALAAGEVAAAARLCAQAHERWGDTAAFRASSLATQLPASDHRSTEYSHVQP